MTFRLAEPEARVLEAFCRRQLAWDDRTAARVLLTPTALGLFTVPPLGVFAFMAVPVAGSADPADITVPLAALADVLGSERHLDDAPALRVTAADGLTRRTGPGTGFSIVELLPAGTRVRGVARRGRTRRSSSSPR